MGSSAAIDDFLAQRRIAVVGVSRNPKDFTRVLFRELKGRRYDVVPVNPLGGTIEDQACFRRLQDVVPPVGAALLMTPPRVTEEVVRDCAEAGVARVWMHRGAGPGAVSEAAVEFCREHGIAVVAGACPYMFLPESGFLHGLHRLLLRLAGRRPGRSTEAPAGRA